MATCTVTRPRPAASNGLRSRASSLVLPTTSLVPATVATPPCPGRAVKDSACGSFSARSSASPKIAIASGCSLIAIGTGTDVAIEPSDLALISGNVEGVLTAIELSRRRLRVIRQNLAWAFGYNGRSRCACAVSAAGAHQGVPSGRRLTPDRTGPGRSSPASLAERRGPTTAIVGARATRSLRAPRARVHQLWSEQGPGGDRSRAWRPGRRGCRGRLGRTSQLSIGAVAGMAPTPIAVAYGVGRLGCLLAGDGTYGIPSGLPWAMSCPEGTLPTTERVHRRRCTRRSPRSAWRC
jgi:hypothetical protein